VENLTPSAPLGGTGMQALAFHGRERRRSLAGVPELFRTHHLYDVAGGALAVATIDTAELFPVRSGFVTFATLIRITENAGVHAGLVFEFGDAAGGCALWIEDEGIGFHAGAAGDADGATAFFDQGAELPVGLELALVASVRPGDGRVRLFGNGREIARAQATNETFDPLEWSTDGAGSFASNESGTVVTDVPAGSAQAPAGFEVLRPLAVYVNQIPRHFF
jgi:hypothetical protein